jgi:hypothetical protein
MCVSCGCCWHSRSCWSDCGRCRRDSVFTSRKEGRKLALYELSVVKLNGGIELRYTDQPPLLGGTVNIDGRAAQIVSRHVDVVSPNAIERFVCRVITATPGGSNQSS